MSEPRVPPDAPLGEEALRVLSRPWSIGRTLGLLALGRSSPGWSGARILRVELPASLETLRAWLPAPLVPEPSVTFCVASYPETSWGRPYREVFVLAHATLHGRSVRYVAWIVVDDGLALVFGRELGFPKKMATIAFSEDDRALSVRVSRYGETLLELDATLHEPWPTIPAFLEPVVTLRGSLGPGRLLLIQAPERVSSCRSAVVSLRVRPSLADPLEALALPSSRAGGLHFVADLASSTIVPGVHVTPGPRVSWRYMIESFPFRAM